MIFESAGAALVAGFTSLALTKLVISVARRFQLFEKTDNRRTHSGDIPFLGGIGIAVGFMVAASCAYLLFLRLHPARAFSTRYLAAVLLGISMIHVTGVVDDFRNIPAMRKLALQLMAAAIAISGGVLIEQVNIVGGSVVIVLGPLSVPFTLLWIVAVSNAVNLIDGMDGLAGGVSLIAVTTLGFWAYLTGDTLLLMLCASLVGALVGFLYFNLPPARVFMGDGGSLFLGFCLAVLPLVSGRGTPAPFPLPALALLLLVPAADTIAAIVRRAKRNVPFHTPDREHVHHKLQDLGLSARQALLVIYAFCIMGALSASAWLFMSGIPGMILRPAAGIIGAGALWWLYNHSVPEGAQHAAPARTSSIAATLFYDLFPRPTTAQWRFETPVTMSRRAKPRTRREPVARMS